MNKNKRTYPIRACFYTCIFLLPAIANAQLLNIDFQSEVAGELPTHTSFFSKYPPGQANQTNNNEIYVVDESTENADPFGISGNKSLFLHDDALSGGKRPVAQFSLPAAQVLRSGTLSFDFYIDSNAQGETGIFELNIGQLGTADTERNNSLASFQFWTAPNTSGDTRVTIMHSGLNQTAYNDLELDVVNNFSITWNETGFSAYLNGTLLTISGNSIFGFYSENSPDGVSEIRFTTTGQHPANLYIDNISVIPEPSTSAMAFALSAILLIAGRRMMSRN